MKRSILLSLFLIYLLSACGSVPVQTIPTSTVEVFLPTETPANTSTPTLTPSPTSIPITIITADNATQLVNLHTFEDQTSSNHAIFSPNGKFIVALDLHYLEGTKNLVYWDTQSMSFLPPLSFEVNPMHSELLTFESSGDLFATIAQPEDKGEQILSVHQLSDLKQIDSVEFQNQELGHVVNDIEWSPNGQFIALGIANGQVQVYGLDTLRRVFDIKIQPREANSVVQINAISFSPDSQLLAAAGQDEVVHIWSTSDWSEKSIIEDSATPILDIDFSPDGKFLAIAEAGGLHVWDMEKGTRVPDFHPTYKEFSVSYSPDGTLLAAAGNDRHVRIWRTDNFELVADLKDHKARVISLDFSPDGQFLASGAEYGEADYPPSVILWGLP